MKILTLSLFAVMTMLSFGQSGSHYCAEHKSRVGLFNQNRSNTLSLSQIETTEDYDVFFYNLILKAERTTTDLSGVVEIHSKVTARFLTSFLFELHEDLVINSILINNVNATFSRSGSAVTVPVNFIQGEIVVATIDYEGTPPNASTNPLAGGGITNASSPTWGNQVTWSLSQPFSAYEWWPCKQSLTDKADSVFVSITTDSTNKAGSNGLLEAVVDLGNGKKRYEWQSFYPIDYYLISFSVAEYVDYSIYANPTGATSPILIQNYIYNNPQTLPNFQSEIDNTVDFLEHFSDLFGLYPFHNEKYGHCMAPVGGGMEHQTMTTQGWFEDGLTAHELGHQWFGDNVTCATWADIWLNEGFASYSEYLMNEQFNAGNAPVLMQGVHNDVMDQPGGSVWVEDSLNTARIFSGRLTYDKGSAIIHTLRFLIDDDNIFFDILRTYQSQFTGSTARLPDFKLIAENLSGLDLTDFFSEWYYGEGFPTYSVTYNQVGTETIIEITQTTSMSGVTPFFTNDLELKFTSQNNSIATYRIPITANVVNYSVPFANPIASVTIDPNNWIVNNDGVVSEDLNLVGINVPLVFDFEVYPIPSSDFLTVKSQVAGIAKLYDINGKWIKNLKVTQGKNTFEIVDLVNGNYILSFHNKSVKITVE